MIALPLCIIFSTYLVVCFKYFEKFGIHNLQAIVFNYITCVLTGIIVTQQIPDAAAIVHSKWFPIAALLGCNFFCIFNLMGYVANNIGVTVTSVASKLSMVIPVTVAVFLFNDPLTMIKITALLLAMVAVYLSSVRVQGDHHLEVKGLLLAFIIFLGSGLNDTLVNYASKKLMPPEDFNNFNITIFFFAAFSGILVLLYRGFFLKKRFPVKAVVGGIVLGIPNYFSLLFLIKALNIPGWNSSTIFPINNMGIVVLSAVSAYVLFREKLSAINLTGIAIGIAAITLIIFA